MRGKGEGSIYRRNDGYWVGQIDIGRHANGRRRYSRVVRKRRADVVTALDDLRAEVRDGVVPDRESTVSDVFAFWLDDVTSGQVSEGTLEEYRKRIKRLDPLIGHVKIARLTVPQCQAAGADLQRRYAPKTTRTTIETLRAALGWAVTAGMMSRNPAEHVRLARAPKVTIDDALTADEARAVLAAAEGHPLEVMFWLALNYGLRIGEISGLDWGDVDLDGQTLTIRKSKTDAGVRTLPLTDEAARRIKSVGPSTGPIWPPANGRKWRHQTIRNNYSTVLAAAGIKHLCRACGTDQRCSTSVRRFHMSRHTAATLLLEAGVALEVVSAILGHSSISVTADIYAKVRGDLKRRGLEALDLDQ